MAEPSRSPRGIASEAAHVVFLRQLKDRLPVKLGEYHVRYSARRSGGISYASAPAGYAADFGVTRDGRTLLVEINDGYSLGSYGLQHNLYAQLLSARWAELLGVPDECAFF